MSGEKQANWWLYPLKYGAVVGVLGFLFVGAYDLASSKAGKRINEAAYVVVPLLAGAAAAGTSYATRRQYEQQLNSEGTTPAPLTEPSGTLERVNELVDEFIMHAVEKRLTQFQLSGTAHDASDTYPGIQLPGSGSGAAFGSPELPALPPTPEHEAEPADTRSPAAPKTHSTSGTAEATAALFEPATPETRVEVENLLDLTIPDLPDWDVVYHAPAEAEPDSNPFPAEALGEELDYWLADNGSNGTSGV